MNQFEEMQEAARRERQWATLFMAFSIVLLVGFVAAVAAILTRS